MFTETEDELASALLIVSLDESASALLDESASALLIVSLAVSKKASSSSLSYEGEVVSEVVSSEAISSEAVSFSIGCSF